MKKLYLNLILSVLAIPVFSQSYVNVKKDTIVAKGELIIDNASKNTQGYLYNTGNGITKFKPIDTSLDSMWSSSDTLYYRKGGVANYVVTSSVWKRGQTYSGSFFLFPSKNKFDKVMIGNNISSGWDPPSTLNVDGNTYLGGNIGVNMNPVNNYAISASGNVGGISVSGLTDITAPNFNSFKTGWYLNFKDSMGGNFIDYQSNLYQSDGAYFYGNSVIGFNSSLRWGGVNGGGGYLKNATGFNAGINTNNNGNVKKYIAFHSSGNNSYAQQTANNYYTALEADSVVNTTFVYGVNQHGSNATNNFEGSRFLLPKLPVTVSSGYKLSWNPSDGSVFVSTDGGGIGGVSPLTWQGALVNSSNLTQRNVSNAGGNTFVLQNTDTAGISGNALLLGARDSVELKSQSASIKVKPNGLDMNFNPLYNLNSVNINTQGTHWDDGSGTGFGSTAVNIGMGGANEARNALVLYSKNYDDGSGHYYSRFQLRANEGGSGSYLMPSLSMFDISNTKRFYVNGRGMGYLSGSNVWTNLSDLGVYINTLDLTQGTNYLYTGIQNVDGKPIVNFFNGGTRWDRYVNEERMINRSTNKLIFFHNGYGTVTSEDNFQAYNDVVFPGNPGFMQGFYSNDKGILFPSLNNTAANSLVNTSDDYTYSYNNNNFRYKRQMVSGNMFWNYNKNRFQYVYGIDTLTNNYIKGSSFAAEGLPSNNIRTAAASEIIDLKYGSFFKLSVNANTTLSLSNIFDGTTVRIALTANGSSHNLTFPGGWKWVSPSPTSLAANETGFIQLTIFDSSNIFAEYKKGT